jgi:hypothetical protein
MTKQERLAYFAGIIDGEGYIGIKKHLSTLRSGGRGRGINPCYYERICVAGTNKPMINMLVKTFNVGNLVNVVIGCGMLQTDWQYLL